MARRSGATEVAPRAWGYADSAAPASTFRKATTWIASATPIEAANAGPIPITGSAGCRTT